MTQRLRATCERQNPDVRVHKFDGTTGFDQPSRCRASHDGAETFTAAGAFCCRMPTQSQELRMIRWKNAAAAVLFAALPVAGHAGCLKGAAVGGVAGHVAGHHAALGAAAGCAIGHHETAEQNKKNAQAAAAQQKAAPPQQTAPQPH